MHQKSPEHAIVCPLFAEWKLTDAAREFGATLGIPDITPATRIPLHPSLTGDPTAHRTDTRYLPFTITGWHRTRRGCRFVFGINAETAYHPATGTPSSPPIPQTPVHLPVTPPEGYFTTLRRMHRHGLPLTQSESLIAGALAAVFDRRPAQKKHRCRPLLLTTDATRIALPEGEIYDLPLGRRLSPEEAASEGVLRQSHTAYRIARGYECTETCHSAAPETFLTADLHLGHRNAISYYCRPFLPDDTAAMDRILTANWNHTVSPNDRVIFAGDFTYKADRETTAGYRSRLNGSVTWIEGNHDTCLEGTGPSHTFTADGREFLVIHNPKHAPAGYRGWVIHGHTHNARLGKYPFISFTTKTVNISTDVTGYRPVPLTEVLALINAGEATGRTAPILTREIPAATDITPVAPSS
ncbi:metallophosphoesterase [Methanogenium sp. S4BF]|uniref:metallophosphoesterase family protein n=1 Tax=Methanogenium sp. S4BF TaxID=1789226 RepID=UPI002416E627|nr:metallophosphoesterase family protein [Methanogenium sp. S4BF]WFN34974.1 metallophosphoesterase [Methanogenium sp. S4BF]